MTDSPYTMEGPPGPTVRINGDTYLYFAGTSYLGLHRDERVIDAAADALATYGTGSATARPGFGTQRVTRELEQTTASFMEAEDAFVFPSGYAGNAVLLQSLGDRFDRVLVEKEAHASAFDAVELAGCRAIVFERGNIDDLLTRLRDVDRRDARIVLMTDGVGPVRGDIAPIPRYLEVLDALPGSALIVDDAHGLGVLGKGGRGTSEHFGLLAETNIGSVDTKTPNVAIYSTATLSKAVGGFGGVIAGDAALIDRLKSRSASYSATSPLPAAMAAASRRAIEIVADEPDRRQRLEVNGLRLRRGLRSIGLAVEDWPTPIVAFGMPGAEANRALHDSLLKRLIAIGRFADYCGAAAAGVLRAAVCSEHNDEMIDRLIEAIACWLENER